MMGIGKLLWDMRIHVTRMMPQGLSTWWLSLMRMGQRLEALYIVALGLGLRKGEILGLRWEDVDLDRAVIYITGALQRQNGRLERSATETEASVRVLALPPNQFVSLRRH
jgi:integrase